MSVIGRQLTPGRGKGSTDLWFETFRNGESQIGIGGYPNPDGATVLDQYTRRETAELFAHLAEVFGYDLGDFDPKKARCFPDANWQRNEE